MAISEEERRRCIIAGNCPDGLTQTQALADELAAHAGISHDEGYTNIADWILKHYTLSKKE